MELFRSFSVQFGPLVGCLQSRFGTIPPRSWPPWLRSGRKKLRISILAAWALLAANPVMAAESRGQGHPALAQRVSAWDAQSETGGADVGPSNNAAHADWLRIRRQANQWEAAYLTLSAVDVLQTCDALSRGVARESNPLFGKNPKCGKLVAAKAILGGLHFLLFDALRDRSPRAARLGAQLSVGIQGAVVGLNVRYLFKGR